MNAYVCHALSNLEKRLRNFDRAKEILEEVVKIKPTAALCVSLGELQRQLGNPEAARTTLKEGLKFCRSERSKLLLALAWIEEDAFDDLKEAEKLISQALAADKQNVRVYVAKAMMELRLGNVEIARETLLQATKIVSEDAQHYTMLSTLELEYGNIDKAREVLAEGAQKFPGDQFLLQRWGTLEAKFGNVKEARRLFQKSIEIQPHAPTFVAWAMLEESEGNLV